MGTGEPPDLAAAPTVLFDYDVVAWNPPFHINCFSPSWDCVPLLQVALLDPVRFPNAVKSVCTGDMTHTAM
jgi:hypothetical protein